VICYCCEDWQRGKKDKKDPGYRRAHLTILSPK
jgi:hypothetical protein